MSVVKCTWVSGALCFGVFVINLLIGKIRLLTQTGVAPPLDGVPEFLVFALSFCFFSISMLLMENTSSPIPKGGPHDQKNLTQ